MITKINEFRKMNESNRDTIEFVFNTKFDYKTGLMEMDDLGVEIGHIIGELEDIDNYEYYVDIYKKYKNSLLLIRATPLKHNRLQIVMSNQTIDGKLSTEEYNMCLTWKNKILKELEQK